MNTEELRVCKTCGIEKPITSFSKTVSEGNGKTYRRHECYSCGGKRHLEWRDKNRDKLRESGKIRQQQYRDRKKASMGEQAFLAEQAKVMRARNARLKAEVYANYGGFKCACCGETEPRFLSIDHVNNDGYKLRKEQTQGSGLNILTWLKKHNYPDGYQILCMNCQHGKARNGGVCPHQQKV